MRAAYAALPGALLAALVLFCSFRAGGLGADITGAVCVALLALLAIWSVAAERPFATLSRPLAAAALAIAALAALSALSALWSDTPARALGEAIRVLAYALTLTTFGLIAASPRGRSGVAGGLTVAAAFVCVAALASRLAPDIVETTPNIYPSRLSWPITYWNALGLLAATALVMLVHASATARSRGASALAAGLLPPVAVTLLLTYSRGSLAVAVLGLALYAALAWSRALAATLVAAAAPTAVAIAAARADDDLGRADAATTPEHALALVVAACAAAAAGLRVVARRGELRGGADVAGGEPPEGADVAADGEPREGADPDAGGEPRAASAGARRRRAAVVAVALLAAAVVAVAGARTLDGFTDNPDRAGVTDARQRLLDPSGGGRDAYWEVAVDAFADAPLAGSGAGSFRSRWIEDRPVRAEASRAHSLELEALADLGIAGFALLAAALAACGAALYKRRAEPAAAALLAAATAWLVHASVDWDWHLPATTLWVVAAGGAALGATSSGTRATPTGTRAAIAAALLVLALPVALFAIADRRTENAVDALERDDCETATDAADTARRLVALRPEPYAVAAICDARAGDLQAASAGLADAADRAPGEWEYAYDRAVVASAQQAEATARSELARARALNPLNPDAQALQERARGAAQAPLFLNGVELSPLGD